MKTSSNANAVSFERANPDVAVNDAGAAYVHVAASSAFAAFSAALDYVGLHYPDHTFVIEGPFGVGSVNGAYLSGAGYILRAA